MDQRDWLVAGVMGAVHFTFHAFMRIVPSLIPVLAIELGFPLWKLGLLVSVYFAGSSVGLLPSGVLSDRYDRKALISGGIAFVGTGYLLFALAPLYGPDLPTVTVGSFAVDGTLLAMNGSMFVAGLGTSVHIPVGVPIITANASPGNEGKLLGIWGGASKLGDAATPALIGVFILVIGWSEIVLLFGAFGLVFAIALFGLLSLESVDTAPSTPAAAEDETSEPDHHWRRNRRTYLYPMVVLMLYFAGYQVTVQGVVTFTPTFVADVYAYSFVLADVYVRPESFADFALSVLLLSGALSRFGAGVLVDRYEHRVVLVGTLALATVGLLAFSVLSLGPVMVLAILAVFGGALWGHSPARDALISDLSPTGREGRTFSYLWTVSRLFGAGAPVVIGFMADTLGIRAAFGYLTVAVFTATVAVSLLFSKRVYVGGGNERTVAR